MSAAVMKPSEALRKARHLITPEEAWTKGSYAQDKLGNTTNPLSSTAVCWCALGSLQKVTNYEDPYYIDARHYLRGVTGWSVPSWQDASFRTHAEVLAVFDRAIALAEAEGR